jgi:hypothetical protein
LITEEVKVTGAPEHILLAEAEIVTEGTTFGVIVILIELLVAVVVAKQVALDVNWHVITSPLVSVLSV